MSRSKTKPARAPLEIGDRVVVLGRPIRGTVIDKVGTWCRVRRDDGLVTIFDAREMEPA